MRSPHIRVKGARQNNLKNLDINIRLNQITAVTGLSGSGKSSLAFDTLYAEGQRRYIETFSPYARQFMDRMDRPNAESIEDIPPSIAINRKDPVRTSRSTVGTMTEINDYVKLLYARMGQLHCEKCGQPVISETPEFIWKRLQYLPENSKLFITFSNQNLENTGEEPYKDLLRMGFDRVFVDGTVRNLEHFLTDNKTDILDILVDRVVFKPDNRKRIIDSLEMAFRLGGGRLAIHSGKKRMPFSEFLQCPICKITYKPPSAGLFSFNSPVGACEICRGFGRTIDIDFDMIIPDPSLSIRQGAIKPWPAGEPGSSEYRDLIEFCRKNKIPIDKPFRDLSEKQKKDIIDGTPTFYGVRGFFRWLETKTYKMPVRVFLSRYRSYDICKDCGGTRFKKEPLLYQINGKNIANFYSMNVNQALDFAQSIKTFPGDKPSLMVLEAVKGRLKYLKEVGVGYLTLDRQSRTLSGGEVQRVSLAAALGASLVNTLYVLDEPSIGLHPRDTQRLIKILSDLRDLPNTLVIVEHDPDIIKNTDYLLDLGPLAGEGGGEIMYFGPTAGVNGSLTGQYLRGEKNISVPEKRRSPQKGAWLTVKGASENNLKSLDIRIPMGLFVCLTGVSGSGKSTLAENVLYHAVKKAKGVHPAKPGSHIAIMGTNKIADIIMIDQRPIGRSPRANVLTYSKALGEIRKLMANTTEAGKRGFDPGYFSFNVAKGRCASCKGEGYEKVEMQFLSDIYITCPECGGKRFNKDVLEVRYKGKNISDIFSMTIDEALIFFKENRNICEALKPLKKVGMGYIRLGQPISTFSGGEAQRLKLSAYLAGTGRKNRFFIFDEPSTGLHFEDIEKLLKAFQELVENDNTVLVIEHNLDIIKSADWVIDLGPEGGEQGGFLVAEGPPEMIADSPGSHTGFYLKKRLSKEDCLKIPTVPKGVSELSSDYGKMITVEGAREHNLKNISLTIPQKELVVLTGVSGSGKSTLAFDILFAEGQRRYLESLAPFVRQYIKVMERPDVDMVWGISPTVAIEQRISHSGRRSTVATLTETYHFLRLLFSKLGVQHCPGCGGKLMARKPEEIVEIIAKQYADYSAQVLAVKVSGRKGFHKGILTRAFQKGYQKVRIDGHVTRLKKNMSLSRYHEHTIEIVVGDIKQGRCHIQTEPNNETSLGKMIQTALFEGEGSFILKNSPGKEEIFCTRGICPRCGISVENLDPRLFSFNSRQGACPVCRGLGVVDVVIPEKDQNNIDGFDKSTGDARVCPECMGSRLKNEVLQVKIDGYSIWDIVKLSAEEARRKLSQLRFDPERALVAAPIMAELSGRLDLLNRLGLSYLSLGRSGNTLSGGEAQRVRLAAQLGSNLTGVCYILDEPTIGLHPRDNNVLIEALKNLRDRGNTVIVVEHDEDMIREADTIIDLGPGAGQNGGEVIATGKLVDLKKNKASITGQLFNGEERLLTSRLRPYAKLPQIRVKCASANNLKDIDVTFPLGTLTCVTGVSGSGKSTLIKETLYKALRNRLLKQKRPEGTNIGIKGWKHISRVQEVDHSPIGRNPRSVPASYIGFLTCIRRLFSGTPEARRRGYLPGRFSFNTRGGRCENCRGHGVIKTTMSFLPDVYVRCDVCNGRRFNEETLAVTYKGKSISDVLELTFTEAADFFSAVPSVKKAVRFVCEIGLGYLRLGQSSPTLSGGEAQRIKLASELSSAPKGHTLFILDEPTTGLHLSDVRKLIRVIQALIDSDNTVVVIEHNLEIIKEADYIIDLGPEGGYGGGQVMASCSPLEMIQNPNESHTARFLRKFLGSPGK